MRFNGFDNTKVISGVARLRGFTLIEIIVGLVALSISMTVILALIVPTEQQSADQIHQVKAAELGQSLLDDILGRAFDENSDMAGGHWRCNETGQASCTAEGSFGPEAPEVAGDRSSFDDVDDFDGFSIHASASDTAIDASYGSFTLIVNVSYDGETLGLAHEQAKRVTVTVTTPLKTAITFTGYKANF